MSYKKILMAFMCCFYFHFAKAQVDIEHMIEAIAIDACEDIDYSTLADRLHFYHKNPININEASKEQLQELVFLNPLQINQLLNHRAINGLFIDVLELQAVEAIDPETIHQLAPFITVGPAKLFKK